MFSKQPENQSNGEFHMDKDSFERIIQSIEDRISALEGVIFPTPKKDDTKGEQ